MSERGGLLVTLPQLIAPSALENRSQILALEKRLKELPQLKIEVTHRFSKGLYAREIFIPKGAVLIGKIHRFENLNIISQGDITVLTEEGAKRIRAPFTVVSPPLTKRVGYAHEDTVWTTIHATEETDPEKLEAEFILPNFPDMPTEDEIRLLKGP
jgi:hypothetical protein